MQDKVALAVVIFAILFVVISQKKAENYEIRRYKQKSRMAKRIFAVKHYGWVALICAVITAAVMAVILYIFFTD